MGFLFLSWLLLAGQAPAEDRAIAYLAREVPLWSKQNRCFSCHNNGDGARALYAARQLRHRVPAEALDDTTKWLLRPLEWDNNRGDPAFSDKKLARIQFAASLTEGVEAGVIRERNALRQAAESLLPYQEADGSWQVDTGAAVGSPATYGAHLATYMARRTLERADASRFQDPITRADRWFLETTASTTLDAAAVVLALADRRDPRAEAKVRRYLKMILHGPGSDGGWGPQPHSPSEPFDTAVVLLALLPFQERAEVRDHLERGRVYLVRTQLPTGGWPETTRPPGAQSYAQHISTSGWATLALLKTRADKPADKPQAYPTGPR